MRSLVHVVIAIAFSTVLFAVLGAFSTCRRDTVIASAFVYIACATDHMIACITLAAFRFTVIDAIGGINRCAMWANAMIKDAFTVVEVETITATAAFFFPVF